MKILAVIELLKKWEQLYGNVDLKLNNGLKIYDIHEDSITRVMQDEDPENPNEYLTLWT